MTLTLDASPLPASPLRPADAHKGTFGTVVVVGGSAAMIGAPALSAGAALRSGAGLVKILTDPAIVPAVLTLEPCATAILAGTSAMESLDRLTAADPDESAVLAIGPGMGQSEYAFQLVEALIGSSRHMVLDADALNILAQIRPGGITALDRPQLVLTPHPGEFRRLAASLGILFSPTDPAQRPQAAAALARAFNAIVLLKGKDTVISDGRKYRINHAANPAMATAGCGDVLTGLIAALMAQGQSAWQAAVLGAHLHSLAGESWLREIGPSGMTAMDLLHRLPLAFKTHRQHTDN